MAILNIAIETPNLEPRLIRVKTNDALSEITSANYLEGAIKQGFTFYETDLFEICDSSDVTRIFRVSITSSAITLSQTAGEITTSVTSGDFVIFDGTSGDLKDAGYSPSNAAKTKVVMANGATVANNLATFADTSGTVKDAGARILAGTTPTYGGGGTSNAFAVTGLTSAAVGSAVIRTSTNAVSIAKALPGTNTLTITFSADPGAGTTVDYNYSTAALT
jgi:hypothetical protein